MCIRDRSSAGSASSQDPGTVVAQDDNTTVSVKSDGTATVAVNEGYTGDTTVTLTAEDGKITTGTIGAAEDAGTPATGEGPVSYTHLDVYKRQEIRCPFGGTETGGAWLSSARVVRCWVKSRNERNPYD